MDGEGGGGGVGSMHWVCGRVRCHSVSGCDRSRHDSAPHCPIVWSRCVRMMLSIRTARLHTIGQCGVEALVALPRKSWLLTPTFVVVLHLGSDVTVWKEHCILFPHRDDPISRCSPTTERGLVKRVSSHRTACTLPLIPVRGSGLAPPPSGAAACVFALQHIMRRERGALTIPVGGPTIITIMARGFF